MCLTIGGTCGEHPSQSGAFPAPDWDGCIKNNCPNKRTEMLPRCASRLIWCLILLIIKGKSFWTHLLTKHKKNHVWCLIDIYRHMYTYILGNVCVGMKGRRIVRWKWSTYRGLNSKTAQKSKWKHFARGWSILPKFNCSNSKWSCYVCIHTWECRGS